MLLRRCKIVRDDTFQIDSYCLQTLGVLRPTKGYSRSRTADDQALLVAGLTWPSLPMVPVSIKTLFSDKYSHLDSEANEHLEWWKQQYVKSLCAAFLGQVPLQRNGEGLSAGPPTQSLAWHIGGCMHG